MVKHTQTIRRQIADELFECVGSFYEIGAKRAKFEKLTEPGFLEEISFLEKSPKIPTQNVFFLFFF